MKRVSAWERGVEGEREKESEQKRRQRTEGAGKMMGEVGFRGVYEKEHLGKGWPREGEGEGRRRFKICDCNTSPGKASNSIY